MTAIGPPPLHPREAIAELGRKGGRGAELVGGARWKRSKRIVLREVVGGARHLDSKERRR